jgi:hypothetical protein
MHVANRLHLSRAKGNLTFMAEQRQKAPWITISIYVGIAGLIFYAEPRQMGIGRSERDGEPHIWHKPFIGRFLHAVYAEGSSSKSKNTDSLPSSNATTQR